MLILLMAVAEYQNMPQTKKIHLMDFSACSNFKELWESLHHQLKPYKIKSIFYGVTYSKRSIEEIGILKSIVYQTTHPKEYWTTLFEALFPKKTEQDHPNLKFLLDEDLTAKDIFLSNKEYFLWADPAEWQDRSDIEQEINQKLIDMQLITGVTIPLRNSKFIAGIGLSAGSCPIKNLNIFGQNHQKTLLS